MDNTKTKIKDMAEIHTGQPGNTPFKENWHNKELTMKEEAQRLVERFELTDAGGFPVFSKLHAKQCAKICVKEIIEVLLSDVNPIQELRIDTEGGGKLIGGIKYYQQLIKEIDKL